MKRTTPHIYYMEKTPDRRKVYFVIRKGIKDSYDAGMSEGKKMQISDFFLEETELSGSIVKIVKDRSGKLVTGHLYDLNYAKAIIEKFYEEKYHEEQEDSTSTNTTFNANSDNVAMIRLANGITVKSEYGKIYIAMSPSDITFREFDDPSQIKDFIKVLNLFAEKAENHKKKIEELAK